ncbi:MAG: 2-oxoacid:acceptor oxidoreductase family protein [Proteobacteria bacterium]|nr:2-oxoacid:acceptor oxidoreductase family protein [Pseudomonadota bacterium]
MDTSIKQQIVISGVGGQGVLFVTGLLAEAAILKGLPVFTSETHGMAQRGGTVMSHVKVGQFSSPLIRPLHADGLLALKANSLVQHGFYLKSKAWAAVNSSEKLAPDFAGPAFYVDADSLAQQIKNPKSANLILLGFALAATTKQFNAEKLFCSLEDIRTVLKKRLADKKKMLDAAIEAVETGYNSL